jgi:hypothetical protein
MVQYNAPQAWCYATIQDKDDPKSRCYAQLQNSVSGRAYVKCKGGGPSIARTVHHSHKVVGENDAYLATKKLRRKYKPTSLPTPTPTRTPTSLPTHTPTTPAPTQAPFCNCAGSTDHQGSGGYCAKYAESLFTCTLVPSPLTSTVPCVFPFFLSHKVVQRQEALVFRVRKLFFREAYAEWKRAYIYNLKTTAATIFLVTSATTSIDHFRRSSRRHGCSAPRLCSGGKTTISVHARQCLRAQEPGGAR